MRTPHLVAALCAFALLGGLLLGGMSYIDRVETTYVHAFASTTFSHKRQGLALQQVALRQTDLLPVYGSSELLEPSSFRADRIFRLYPTGFNVFTVAGNGDEPLMQAQIMAGLGAALQNKRVVISLSPQFFIESRMAENAYRANFSRLHAYAFALSNLPAELKQRIARRMLQYAVVPADPLLQTLLEQIGDGNPRSLFTYALLYPIGRLTLLTLELQDRWATLNLIQAHPEIDPTVTRRDQDLNWEMLLEHGRVLAQGQSSSNSFGIDDTEWKHGWRDLMSKSHKEMTDAEFGHALDSSQTWNDLEMLLETLKARGAIPLLVTMPWHGGFWSNRGVSVAARQRYYAHLAELASKENIPLVTFQEFEQDKYFLRDPGSHLSAEGWVRYSQVLDAFFHARLGTQTQ